METLISLGIKLIEAKKRYFRAEYNLESVISEFDISFRREMKQTDGKTTETAIKNKVMEHARPERNEIKLAQINLAEAEIKYEIEKLRLQYEGIQS